MIQTGSSQPELQPAISSEKTPPGIRAFVALGIYALMLRLVIAPLVSHHVDMNTFTSWGLHLANVGGREFWSGNYWCDYLPGYLFILWITGKIAALLPSGMSVLIFKFPNLLADILTAYLLWRLVNPTFEKQKLWVPALYLFNPAVLANSTLWGQVDSFHSLCLVLPLFLLTRKRSLAAAAVLGFACAVKPHTVVILPLVFILAVSLKINSVKIALCVPVTMVVFAATFIPFHSGSLLELPAFINARISETMGQYGYATVNGMNFWYLLGQNWQPDDRVIAGPITVQNVGRIVCIAGYLFALAWFRIRHKEHRQSALWESAAIIYLVTYLFITRAHERHVFPFFAMALVTVAFHRPAIVPYILVSVLYCVNLALSWLYILEKQPSASLCQQIPASIICILYLASLPILLLSFGQRAKRWFPEENRSEAQSNSAG